MKVAGLLTGRGNNTLKDKNLIMIGGKPVMYYPAIAGKEAKLLDLLYCSSDDDNILNTAKELGYTPIKRPEELARPTSQHIDCINHAVDVMNHEGVAPDVLVVILANNVTIKAKWIDECVEKIIKDQSLTAVVPVYMDNDHHPYRAKKLNSEGCLEPFVELAGNVSTNRQDLKPCMFLAHNFWVIRTKNLDNGGDGQLPWTFLGNKIAPYEIEESIDIHRMEDVLLAENWVSKNC